MQINELEHVMGLHPEVDVLSQELSKKGNKHFLLSGLYASARGMILAALHSRLKQKGEAPVMLIVMDNADDAQYMYADIKTLTQAQDVYYFPNSHRRRQGKDEAMTVQRTEVLSALLGDEAMRLKGDRAMSRRLAGLPGLLCTCVVCVGYKPFSCAKARISSFDSMGSTKANVPFVCNNRALFTMSSR